MQVAYLCLSALSASLLQLSYGSALAYEHPVHTAILSLLVTAASFYVVNAWCASLFGPVRVENSSYELMSIRGQHDRSEYKDDHTSTDKPLSPRVQTLTTLLAAVVLALRIEIFRRVRQNGECTSGSLEALTPLILSIYNAFSQRTMDFSVDEAPDSSVYEYMGSNLWNFLLKQKWRYVPAMIIAGIGCFELASLRQGQASTVICPISSGDAAMIPRLQVIGLLLDNMLAVFADISASWEGTQGNDPSRVFRYINVLSGATCIWIAIAASRLIVNIDNASWVLLLRFEWSTILLSMTLQSVLVACFTISTICLIKNHGILSISVGLTLITTVPPAIYHVWSARKPYPVIGFWNSMLSFIAVFFGLWFYNRVRRSVSTSGRSSFDFSLVIPFLVLFAALWPELTKSSRVFFHPIDLLMYDAREQHDQYLQFANHSKDFGTAVALYKARYQGNPPPGFDVWWKFAKDRDATIKDDFDQIHVDLLPFRTIEPRDLRRQIQEIVSNPWNDIAAVSVREGRAYSHKTTSFSHESMLRGVVSMINIFAKDLPDMDLAFNLEDLPRIALPHKESTEISHRARQIHLDGIKNWPSSKNQDLLPSQPELITTTVFKDRSLQNIFDSYVAIHCPPGSAARKDHFNMFQPYTCISCAQPHSFGQFISNWSLAADPCHQPDLAQLYGAYMSPATFKPANELRPVFSQSKMHGFADILYPSAWSYMDTAKYASTDETNSTAQARSSQSHPELTLTHKINSLYWRGTTTEGVSRGDKLWRGMARQRFVHMANNLTNSYHDHVTLLLPDPHKDRRYDYQALSAAQFLSLGLQTNVHMEDHIANCAGPDCADQEEEFGVVAPSDFQEHWKYRFLMDLDGPAATGHMIPFLKSRSVPFKAGMSREWFDSRLTPWRHFVPQDLRFHGLWSTLAYFAGVDGSIGQAGQRIKWDPHVREAEIIAEEGRQWANKVLRKEDMEIYMFRLLLEWARLVDDRRDELGFSLD